MSCIALLFKDEVHDPVFNFLCFILFNCLWLVWLLSIILFLLHNGVDVICSTFGIHMHLVFTTRFEMLSVLIFTWQEVLTLVA